MTAVVEGGGNSRKEEQEIEFPTSTKPQDQRNPTPNNIGHNGNRLIRLPDIPSSNINPFEKIR